MSKGRSRSAAPQTRRKPASAIATGDAGVVAKNIVRKLDPTTSEEVLSGPEHQRPGIDAFVRRARGSLPVALARRFIDVELMPQSAALALYAVLSLAPLLLILLWLTSAMVPDAQEALLAQISLLVGSDAERVARTILANAGAQPNIGSFAGWWSLALLFVGATAVFARLQDVLNKIFRTDATRLPGIMAWVRKRVFSFGLVFALGFLLVISMTVSTVLELAFSHVRWMLPLVADAATWLIYAIGFALMYHLLPDRSVGWRRALGGGAATAGMFLLGRAAIAWYLLRAEPGSPFGAMGTLVLALVWIYYAALIVFVGALLTAVVDERARARSGMGDVKRGRKLRSPAL